MEKKSDYSHGNNCQQLEGAKREPARELLSTGSDWIAKQYRKLGYRKLKTKSEKIGTTGRKFAGSWPNLVCDGIATAMLAKQYTDQVLHMVDIPNMVVSVNGSKSFLRTFCDLVYNRSIVM